MIVVIVYALLNNNVVLAVVYIVFDCFALDSICVYDTGGKYIIFCSCLTIDVENDMIIVILILVVVHHSILFIIYVVVVNIDVVTVAPVDVIIAIFLLGILILSFLLRLLL